ncbi:MAG TPA: M3 family metallopeptidase [Polyangiaceae bacterium]|nr:M3 family metallopeptidase [Polyangiaceae bacterium]
MSSSRTASEPRRRPMRIAALAIALGLFAACGPAPEPGVPTAPAPTVSTTLKPTPTSTAAMPSDASPSSSAPAFDPVPIGMTAAGVTRVCDDHIKAAETLLNEIKSLKGAAADKLTFDATFGRFDRLVLELNNAGEFPYLMGVAHPDAAVRDAAKKCEPKSEKFTTAMWLDADLAGVLKAYAAKGEKLEGERARLVHDVLRDFRRNGLDLPPEKQARLREINEAITTNGQNFISNIGASKETLEVDPKALDGLPPEYVAKHPPNDKGKVVLTTDYPDFFPFVTYARDRKTALDLFVLFQNRGGKKNVEILELILKLRSEKAKLLGYQHWADYATEPRMAKNAKTVRTFLDKVRDALKDVGKVEYTELMKEHVKLGGKQGAKLPPSDRYFLEDRVRAAKFKFNSQELSNYFEIGAVKAGLMSITAKMYGIEYREVPANAWHPDVTAYEVWSGKEVIAKFYLDLYSRPDKYKHAAMFGVRTAARLPDGTYQKPIAALECNFPKPGAQAALMSHEDVVTFFHEFGHVLHHVLTKGELASFSGTATARDFVEAPSQMFEEWAWSREVLDLFAKHHKTGEKIPDDLFEAMQRARTFGRALATQRQLFLATLDLEYHSRQVPFNTTRVLEEVQNATDQFQFVKGTHFQSSFSHLIGYDAGYYGYQWALALSRDVLTRFKKEGFLNPATAAAWRNEVLSKGGGTDEASLITRFLGREPSHDAYIAYLKGGT